jgi:bla regulator protein blaR1
MRVAAVLLASVVCLFPALSGAPAQDGVANAHAVTQAAGAPVDLPRFEVASIKPNKSGSMMIRMQFTPDGVSITGLPLHMLLRQTFGISNDRLLGEPGWTSTARYDIQAKVDAADAPKLEHLTFQQKWKMMQPLMEERFAMKFHHEIRRLTVYALVVAKDGPRLKEAVPGDTYPNGFKGPDGKSGGGMRFGAGDLTAQAIPIPSLVQQLSFQLGATVVDKTNLTGKYDFTLHWSPDEQSGAMMPLPPGAAPPGSGPPPPKENPGPSLFTALQEQLGLKLEAQKEPVDVIVIDHIEPPTPN